MGGRTESKALDERLVEEVKAINAAFDTLEKTIDTGRNSDQPIQVRSFEC
jgi:hypothetical protein